MNLTFFVIIGGTDWGATGSSGWEESESAIKRKEELKKNK
jgi:hypothetical protein